MKVHFIAVGGSIMHNLAIALKLKGYEVSGSDDEIFEPSYSKLQEHGILPDEMGWHPERITEDLDAVILGMHARIDNPELLKAKALGVKVYSFPEYVYKQAHDKKRVVIAGSHGKTTVTSMIVHVLNENGKNPDYLIGAQVKGLPQSVKLTEEAEMIIIEGDEYLTSPMDRQPKFLKYHHHIAVITGIAWDHINVFPTYEEYVQQFQRLLDLTPSHGAIFYSKSDKELLKLMEKQKFSSSIKAVGYEAQPHEIQEGNTVLTGTTPPTPLKVFGNHNLENISAAYHVCKALGLSDQEFYQGISTFEGASLRMQLLAEKSGTKIFRDFAHAPSKVKATVAAVHGQFEGQKLLACLELHTFSSLNKAFIHEYKGSMNAAEEAIVYYSPHTVEHKRLEAINPEEISEAFDHPNLTVFTDANKLKEYLRNYELTGHHLLLMTSGSFEKTDLKTFAEELTAGL
ncbi:UDP-N-acetylmuramate--L-alanine ligase [Algivirga pacifica]|uniref:Mur ligase family protein n=1 Tax=Algivirga pacifica TaxID=1162670 RepID=A0ABP9DE16_9BACT